MRRLPGSGLLNSGRTQAALLSWHPDSPQGCSPAPRGSWGWLGSISMSPAERPGSWQTGTAPSLLKCELGGALSVYLSACREGSSPPGVSQCLIGGSRPSQLDEEEERRKRRREKNKVAAARCRNKKKERTEFLQRVSRAAGRAGRGLCGSKDVINAVGIDVYPLPCRLMPPLIPRPSDAPS